MEAWLIFTQICATATSDPTLNFCKTPKKLSGEPNSFCCCSWHLLPFKQRGWSLGDGGKTAARAGGSYWAVLRGKGRCICHAHGSSSHLEVTLRLTGISCSCFKMPGRLIGWRIQNRSALKPWGGLVTKQTPARECSSCTAQVWDYLQAECFVRPLPKGREARLPFVLLFPPLKREEQRMLPLPESSLTSAQPSDPTPPLPFFQLLCCFSPVSSPLCFQGPPLLCSYRATFSGFGRWINSLPCLAFTRLPISVWIALGQWGKTQLCSLSCVLKPSCPHVPPIGPTEWGGQRSTNLLWQLPWGCNPGCDGKARMVDMSLSQADFLLCRAAQALLAPGVCQHWWVLCFAEEGLWCPLCILEEPNPKFGTLFGIEMLAWRFVVLAMPADTLSGCCP